MSSEIIWKYEKPHYEILLEKIEKLQKENEKLQEENKKYKDSMVMISETCIDISKLHITQEQGLENIRNYIYHGERNYD